MNAATTETVFGVLVLIPLLIMTLLVTTQDGRSTLLNLSRSRWDWKVKWGSFLVLFCFAVIFGNGVASLLPALDKGYQNAIGLAIGFGSMFPIAHLLDALLDKAKNEERRRQERDRNQSGS